MINRDAILTTVKRATSYRPDVKVNLITKEGSIVIIDFPGTSFLDFKALDIICRELTFQGAPLSQIRATESGNLQIAIAFIDLKEKYKYTEK